MKRSVQLSVILLLILLAVGCSFASDKVEAGAFSEQIADMVLQNASYVVGLQDAQPVHIEAQTIELYTAAHKAIVYEGTFTQKSPTEELFFSGRFDKAEIDTNTNNMDLFGAIVIENHKEGLRIEASKLSWDNDNWTATTNKEDEVTIIRQSRDILKGRGFWGDFSTSTFEFVRMEEGHLAQENH